jgi:hypothetical protein
MEKATTWLRQALPGFASLASLPRFASLASLPRFASSLRFACFLRFLCFIWFDESPLLFAVSKQESLLYGKKKALYQVIIGIGTKEVIKWKTYRQ